MSREIKRFFEKKAHSPLVVGLFQKHGIESAVNYSSLVNAVNRLGEPFAEDMVTAFRYPEKQRERIVEFVLSAAQVLGDKTLEPLKPLSDTAAQSETSTRQAENFDGLSIQMGARAKPGGPEEKLLGMPKATGQLVAVLVILIILFVLLKALH